MAISTGGITRDPLLYSDPISAVNYSSGTTALNGVSAVTGEIELSDVVEKAIEKVVKRVDRESTKEELGMYIMVKELNERVKKLEAEVRDLRSKKDLTPSGMPNWLNEWCESECVKKEELYNAANRARLSSENKVGT